MVSSILSYRATPKIGVASLLAAMVLAAIPYADAQVPPLADKPIFDSQVVPPNILFTLDNSGSMTAGYPVDVEISWPYQIADNGYYSPPAWQTRGEPCLSSFQFNPLAYNPATRYMPPYVATSAGADAQLPAVSPSQAPMNGYAYYYGAWRSDVSDESRTDLTSSTGYGRTGWEFSRQAFYPFYFVNNSATHNQAGICYYFIHPSYNPNLNNNSTIRNAYATKANFVRVTPTNTQLDSNPYFPYTLIEVRPGNTYTKHPNRTDCAGTSSCTYAEELQNFANWFSYYRSRANVVRGGVGEAARTIDPSFRVGFQTIDGLPNSTSASSDGTVSNGSGTEYGSFLRVKPFAGTHKGAWYRNLYNKFSWYGTPLRRATSRAGEYFRAAIQPGTSTAITDPILPAATGGECQKHFHILSTDGYWNGSSAGGAAGTGDYDTTIPAYAPSANPPRGAANLLTALQKETGNTYTAGQNWPSPYYGSPGVGDTLADVAMYYWSTDLRNYADRVTTTAADQADWQHMNQYAVAFGARGVAPYVDANNDAAADALPASWAYSGNGWQIDDMWHSAVNGHGIYFNVNSFDTLVKAMGRTFQDIAGQVNSGGSPSVPSANLSASGANDLIFSTTYRPGIWTGDLLAKRINTSTGDVINQNVWQDGPTDSDGASSRIVAQFSGTNWQNRLIITSNGTGGVPMRQANLTAAQLQSLVRSGDPYTASQFLQYLRGDRSLEDSQPGGVFRTRLSLLGDIVNSNPVYVGKPDKSLKERFNPGITAHYTAIDSRPAAVYVGANDGMLHAINGASDVNGGKELWAYVPSQFFRNDFATSSSDFASKNTGLRNLGLPAGGVVPNKFQHRYYVDGKLSIADVDFSRTSGALPASNNWKTIAVGGLGKGGFGYFALDVTSPTAPDEASAATKLLWEFNPPASGAVSMGYSYGSASVMKTKDLGWVVAVPSGYNNATGTGHVWLLRPESGQILYRFDVAGGSSSNPVNLGHIDAYIPDEEDGTADSIYATDMQGRVWRMDLNGLSVGGTRSLATPLANFGTSNPFTTPAVPVRSLRNSNERWVIVGSGRLLADSDKSVAGPYSFFAFKDGTHFIPSVISSPITAGSLSAVAACSSAGVNPPIGWKMQLDAGQNVIDPPRYAAGLILFSTSGFSGSTNPCIPDSDGKVFLRSLDTGDSAINVCSITGQKPSLVITRDVFDNTGKLTNPATIKLLVPKSDGTVEKVSPTKATGAPPTKVSFPQSNTRIIYTDR